MTSELGGSALASLSPVHLRDWLKRLREKIAPSRIRFYAVGEYGDETGRPHYHVILFGFPTCRRGRTLRRGISLEPIWSDCCDICRLVGDSWDLGNVDLGEVTKDSSGYIAGYVVKKMNRFDDPRLNGRYPEFCRMSNKNGGIGKDALWEVASSLMYHHLDDRPDVPAALRVASRTMPLGRYLRGKLREMIGRDGSAPSETLDAIKAELLPVSDYAFNNSKSLKATVVEVNDPAYENFVAKNAIFKKGRSL